MQDDIIQHARSTDSKFLESSFNHFQELYDARKSTNSIFLRYCIKQDCIKTFTYAEFFDQVIQTASYLQENGLQKGDRIATVAHNHWQTIVQYYAAWLLGLTVVPINLGEDDDRIEYIFRAGEVKLAFILDEYENRIRKIIESNSEFSAIQLAHYNDDTHWDADSKNLVLPKLNPNDDALIVFTSGTTGNPKAVLLSQQNLLQDAKAISTWHGIDEQTTMMCVLPIHHVNGTVVTHITPSVVGGSVVLNKAFSVHHFFELIERYRVQVVSVVPTLLQYLSHEYEDKSFLKPKSIHHIICGAGPLTIEVAKTFEDRFDIPIVHGYGLSETTCYSCFLPVSLTRNEHKSWMNDFGYPSIGTPIPINEMAIHDAEGKPVADGERGEIVIRGYNVMKEYYANESATENAFKFGWFRSGDEGFIKRDENGLPYFFITGRIKELIIRGGVNLAPLEIDEVIGKAPNVKAGIAVGFENDWYGEEVGAFVVREDDSIENEDEILEFCRIELPYSKSPKVVLFGNELPITSTGKYQRNKLTGHFKEFKKIQFKKK